MRPRSPHRPCRPISRTKMLNALLSAGILLLSFTAWKFSSDRAYRSSRHPAQLMLVAFPRSPSNGDGQRQRQDRKLIKLVLQHGVPKKKLSCGVTHLDKETFLEYIDNLRETYRADAYHLLSFNCESCRIRHDPP